MKKIQPSDFAFPSPPEYDDGGLTKREYFAARALEGLVANSSIEGLRNEDYAEIAVQQADALIAQLNKEES